MRLDGKDAVITGAASGMGLAMARRFATEGAAVVAADRHRGWIGTAVAEIAGEGGRIIAAVRDIAERATAEGLVDLAVAT